MRTFIKILVFVLAWQVTYAQDLPSPSGNTNQYEFYQMTSIESVVPGGLGRSRLLTRDQNGRQEELDLKNFFSMAGINFKNIQNNEAAIGNKIQSLANEGWELYNTVGGVYSADTSTGIFITRYLFRRIKK